MLLNANVAFFVDPGNHIRTPAQLACYFSIITSVGSVVTGLLLLRQHRAKPQQAVDDVVSYPIRSPAHIPSLTALTRTGISEGATILPSGSKLSRSYTVYRIRYYSGRES